MWLEWTWRSSRWTCLLDHRTWQTRKASLGENAQHHNFLGFWAKRHSRSVTFDLIIAAFPRTCTMTKPLLRRTKRRNRWHWRRQTGQVSCQPGTDFNLNQNYQTKPKGVVTKRKAFGEMEKEFILSGKCTQATTQMRVLDVIFSQRCFQVRNMFKITGKWEIYKSFCPLPLKLWVLSIPCKYGG